MPQRTIWRFCIMVLTCEPEVLVGRSVLSGRDTKIGRLCYRAARAPRRPRHVLKRPPRCTPTGSNVLPEPKAGPVHTPGTPGHGPDGRKGGPRGGRYRIIVRGLGGSTANGAKSQPGWKTNELAVPVAALAQRRPPRGVPAQSNPACAGTFRCAGPHRARSTEMRLCKFGAIKVAS